VGNNTTIKFGLARLSRGKSNAILSYRNLESQGNAIKRGLGYRTPMIEKLPTYEHDARRLIRFWTHVIMSTEGNGRAWPHRLAAEPSDLSFGLQIWSLNLLTKKSEAFSICHWGRPFFCRSKTPKWDKLTACWGEPLYFSFIGLAPNFFRWGNLVLHR